MTNPQDGKRVKFKTCKATGKRAYKKLDARSVAARAEKTFRVYRCPHCSKYHLTSWLTSEEIAA